MCKAAVSNEELAVHQRLGSWEAYLQSTFLWFLRHKDAGGRRSRGGRRRDGDSGDSAVTWQLAIARQTPDTADTEMHHSKNCGLPVMIKPEAYAWRYKEEKSRILITLQTTGCPTIEFSLCFACFLGFLCSYRGSFYHFSTAQETTIPKLTLLSSLCQKLIKLQSKMWGKLDLDIIILVHTRFI